MHASLAGHLKSCRRWEPDLKMGTKHFGVPSWYFKYHKGPNFTTEHQTLWGTQDMIPSNLLRSVLLVLGSVPILRGWEHVRWGSTGFDDMNDPINKLAFPVNSHAWWGMCFWAWQVDNFTTTGGLTGLIFLERNTAEYLNGGVLQWGYPQIVHFCLGFSVLGYPHFRKPPRLSPCVRHGLPVPQVPPQGLHGARQHGGALR